MIRATGWQIVAHNADPWSETLFTSFEAAHAHLMSDPEVAALSPNDREAEYWIMERRMLIPADCIKTQDRS